MTERTASGPDGTWRTLVMTGLSTALAVQAWFRFGQFIASGDISPFERRGLSRELFWAWNHQGTPDGGAAASSARWPEVLIARLGDGLGISGPSSQRVFLTLLAALLGVSIAWMLGPLVKRRLVVAGAALIALANPLTLVTLPNHLPLVAMAAVALLCGAALRTARASPPRAIVFAWLSVLVGYLTLNPPFLAVVLGVAVLSFVVAFLVAGRRAVIAMAPRLGGGLALAAGVSLIWVVPFAFTTLHPGELATFVAPTEVEQWAWTHARSSITNVINLTGQWQWDHPEYVPPVSRLDGQPFAWLRWALPLSVLAAPLAQRDRLRRRISIGILAVAVPLVVIGKGLHPPFSGVNRWLFDHLPGFWLLREPLPKVSAVIVPLYVVAWALLFDGVADRLRELQWTTARRRIAKVGTPVLAGLPLVFGWPIFTGSVFDSASQPDRVAVPAEWEVATRRLQALDLTGKVLQLPLADYYQVGTTWGYYGADTLLAGRITPPVLQRLPGGYFTSRPAVEDLLGVAETALASGDAKRFEEAAGRLGISAVVVRHDFRQDPARPRLADPQLLRASLSRVAGATTVHSGELLEVAHLTGSDLFTRISTVRPSNKPAVLAGPGTASANVDQPVLPKELSQGLVAVGTAAGSQVQVETSGTYRVQVADGTPFSFGLSSGPDGIELQPNAGLALDGQPLPLAPLRGFGHVDEVALIGVDGELVDPAAPGAQLVVSSGATVDAYRRLGPPVPYGLSRLQDCAKTDERSLDDLGITLRPEGTDLRTSVLSAREHRACTPVPLLRPAGAGAVRVSYGEQAVRGHTSEPCLLDVGSQRCLPVIPQRAAGRTDLVAALPDVWTGLTLFLYAEAGSAVRYEVPSVQWLERTFVKKVVAESPAVALEAGSHVVSVEGATKLRSERSEVSNCAGTERPAEAGIRAVEGADGAIELSAERGSACVQYPIAGLKGQLRVYFDHRVEGPGEPRYCVWWEGLNRCASAEPLAANGEWKTADLTFRVPDGATGARLFLYADASPDGGRRTVSYRRVGFADATALVAVLVPADAPPPQPPVPLKSSASRTGSYRVTVPASGAPALLRFADGWSEQWRAQLDKRPLPHLEVDGFANGWVLPPTNDDVVVEVSYGPVRRQALSTSVGFLALLGASAAELALLARRAARRRRATAWERALSEPSRAESMTG